MILHIASIHCFIFYKGSFAVTSIICPSFCNWNAKRGVWEFSDDKLWNLNETDSWSHFKSCQRVDVDAANDRAEPENAFLDND